MEMLLAFEVIDKEWPLWLVLVGFLGLGLDVFRQSAVPQTWLPMSKLDHAASLISSDAASTRKATLQQRTANGKSINAGYNVFFLRRKGATEFSKWLIWMVCRRPGIRALPYHPMGNALSFPKLTRRLWTLCWWKISGERAADIVMVQVVSRRTR
jgi:hypothetical protein